MRRVLPWTFLLLLVVAHEPRQLRPAQDQRNTGSKEDPKVPKVDKSTQDKSKEDKSKQDKSKDPRDINGDGIPDCGTDPKTVPATDMWLRFNKVVFPDKTPKEAKTLLPRDYPLCPGKRVPSGQSFKTAYLLTYLELTYVQQRMQIG